MPLQRRRLNCPSRRAPAKRPQPTPRDNTGSLQASSSPNAPRTPSSPVDEPIRPGRVRLAKSPSSLMLRDDSTGGAGIKVWIDRKGTCEPPASPSHAQVGVWRDFGPNQSRAGRSCRHFAPPRNSRQRPAPRFRISHRPSGAGFEPHPPASPNDQQLNAVHQERSRTRAVRSPKAGWECCLGATATPRHLPRCLATRRHSHRSRPRSVGQPRRRARCSGRHWREASRRGRLTPGMRCR